jgi:hypothetical protein
MTAIKHTLQREVFLPNEERLVSVVHVTKEGKKKKSCFLCASGKGDCILQQCVKFCCAELVNNFQAVYAPWW